MPGGEEEEDEFFEHAWIKEAENRRDQYDITELQASFYQPPPQVEVPRGSIRLRFADQRYALSELVETLEGLEYLILLVNLREQDEGQALPAHGSRDLDWLDGLRNQDHVQVEVQRLSLNSPLEVLLHVGAISTTIVSLLGSWIALRDRLTNSRLKKARADDEIETLVVRRMARGHIVARLSERDYEDLAKGDPLKKMIDTSAESLMRLESVSPNEKSESKR